MAFTLVFFFGGDSDFFEVELERFTGASLAREPRSSGLEAKSSVSAATLRALFFFESFVSLAFLVI